MRGLVKGTAFEVQVSMALSDLKGFAEIKNLQVYSHFLKKPTEIDLLLVSHWGVMSVEIKSFTNHLKGNFSDSFWYGITGRKTTTVFSPVKQNYEHIRSLKSAMFPVLGYYMPIDNYVVCPDTCRVVSDVPSVMNLSNFVNHLVMRSMDKPKQIDFDKVIQAISRARVI